MVRLAIGFLVVGLLGFAIGSGNLGVLSWEAGKLVLEVFVVLSVLSLLAWFFMEKPQNKA